MDIWTPALRAQWIDSAIKSTESSGRNGHYRFKVLSKTNTLVPEDEKRSLVTEALAKVIYENPKYRYISLKFYEMLDIKLKTSTFVNFHYNRNFFLIMKGSNAYRFLLGDMYASDFHFSDQDIMIMVNPFLEDGLFESLRMAIKDILTQVVSQFKKLFDHMFFLNKPHPDTFMDDATIAEFKSDVNTAFANIDSDLGKFVSPFERDEVRNSCSKNSFIIVPSEAQENCVVRIEVPHFLKCERIPLRHTPLMASCNHTLEFNRDVTGQSEMKGHFDLVRLKFNCLYVGLVEKDVNSKDTEEHMSAVSDETGESSSMDMYTEKISADFIDIILPNKDDMELLDFWRNGRCVVVFDQNLNMSITVPDLPTCSNDLYKMLWVYECPQHKREKRERKFKIINNLLGLV